MVKIVSTKPVKTKKIVCPNCGYELEYTGLDIKSYVDHDYGGGSDTVYYIECPVEKCFKQINVSRY